MLTKSLTAAALAGTGDQICQQIEQNSGQEKEFNLRRTMNFMAFGLLINGPGLHYTYTYLLPLFETGTTVQIVAKKVLLTQTLYAPLYNLLFYVFVGQLEGKTLEESK